MKILIVHTILLNLFLVSCASQPANAQSGDRPVFSFSLKNQDDQIEIQHENGVTTIDILSPRGIGSAQLKLESGSMPERTVLRLYFKGLEEVRLISDQATIAASASSSDVFNVTDQRVRSLGNEYSLTPIDPLWMKIEIVSDHSDKNIPLEDGYFEIAVPKEFIRSAGNSFEIQWIDFYR